MTIQYMQPDVWAANLLLTLDKALVFAGAPCSNRDYEGDISAYGNTVHIEHIGDPTISDYTKDTNLSDPESLTDDEQLLHIDQQKSFNFAIDDIDKAQIRNDGATMKEATRRAGFKLRDAADQFAAAQMAASAGTSLGVIDATTATNVYDEVLVPASVALDEVNVPEELRWIVLPPAAYGKLQLDSRFIKQNEAGTDMGLRNGIVGEAAGFRIFKSNNSPTGASHAITDGVTTSGNKNLTSASGGFRQSDIGSVITGTGIAGSTKIVTVSTDGTAATTDTNSTASGTVTLTVAAGTNKLVIAGSQIAHSFAQQILEVQGYKPEKRFGDALKGLHVYGTKVTRSEALVIASVKTS